jgi:hypothetical protein
MKKLNVLSVLSIFLILTAVTIGTVNAATPAEVKQDSRLTALESSVKKIQTRLTALESSVAKILTRLTTVENKVANNAIYGVTYQHRFDANDGTLADLTINVPVDSYVLVLATGHAQPNVCNSPGNCYVDTWIYIDGVLVANTVSEQNAGLSGPFSVSDIYKLKAGTHKISLAETSLLGIPNNLDTEFTLTATVNNNGLIQVN